MWLDVAQGDAKDLCGNEQTFLSRTNKLSVEYMDVASSMLSRPAMPMSR
jgi:hypothetical protein